MASGDMGRPAPPGAPHAGGRSPGRKGSGEPHLPLPFPLPFTRSIARPLHPHATIHASAGRLSPHLPCLQRIMLAW